MPAFIAATLLIIGFCKEEVKPFGPDHEYDAPVTVDADKFNVEPSQRGPLFDAIEAAGIGLIITFVVELLLLHPFDDVIKE